MVTRRVRAPRAATPRQFSVVIEKNQEVRLRDGTATYADIYRPMSDEKVPVIVVRTPYDKEILPGPMTLLPSYQKLAERGYAVVVQDIRGRFSSAGEFYPYAHEIDDGHDTLLWATRQPWSNGSTAIMGASFFGITTVLGARSNPPGLKAMVPIITTDGPYDTWSYQGGAFQLGFLGTWGTGLAAAQMVRPDCEIPREKRQRYAEALANPSQTLKHWPTISLPGVSDPEVVPWWKDWVSHPESDEYWSRWRMADSYSGMKAAGLHIGGWFDIFLGGTIANFVGLTRAGNAPQKMIIGPWTHGSYETPPGVLSFGPEAAATNSGIVRDIVRWYDRFLKGREDVETGPAFRYFLMGANRWEEASGFPLPNAAVQRWFLHSGGSANTLRGDGMLTREGPTEDEPADMYVYHPDLPVPTAGGNILMGTIHAAGPWDQREVEARHDVLVYTSEPLPQSLKVVGTVAVHLWAATDGRDTDWTAKLVEVHPDGRAINLCDGIIRARYREGTDRARLLTPGRPHEYTIDLAGTANLFKAGSRLRVEISSSNFPRFDRNSNTGGNIAQEAAGRLAVQRVHHTPGMPSWLELPVVPA